jgi:linoleoyl-CoA desaturase
MWNLYGKKYDLTNFIDKHPGGNFILEKTEGLEDITALFESYHAFSDIEKIEETLKKYEIKQESSEEYKIDFTEYRELVKLVKEKYPDRISIKANYEYIWNNSLILCIGIISFYVSYMSSHSFLYKCLGQIVYSTCEISIGFNYLHDGSHYGISQYPIVNTLSSKIINSIFLWNLNVWFYHHVYYHHSYTGLYIDPDEMLYKHNDNILTHWIGKYNYILMCFIIIPGQQIGQVFSYYFSQYSTYIPHNRVTTNINAKKKNLYDTVDISIMLIKLYFLYTAGIIQTYIHICIVNLLYFINIYPNHSSYETKIENKYKGNNWAKLQICNSGNFLMDNLLWTRIFGGINYQIEHHLFPNMSNIHYPEVSKIVRSYCKENNLPYVNKETLYEAYKSFEKYVNY